MAKIFFKKKPTGEGIKKFWEKKNILSHSTNECNFRNLLFFFVFTVLNGKKIIIKKKRKSFFSNKNSKIERRRRRQQTTTTKKHWITNNVPNKSFLFFLFFSSSSSTIILRRCWWSIDGHHDDAVGLIEVGVKCEPKKKMVVAVCCWVKWLQKKKINLATFILRCACSIFFSW